ncbi:MAG: ComEC/Rec2 family competence protein [Pyrinomonadaceae bacterium]|nr:ComEC/Rec2 family competence protein [Pyrinomonadaceae bacterium]
MRANSLRQSFASHPLALLAACLACGILTARLTTAPFALCLVSGITVATLALLFHLLRREALATLLLALSFFCAGWALATVEQRRVEPERLLRLYDEGVIASGEPVELTGVLALAPEPAPDGFYLTLRIERLRFKDTERAASGVVWLFAPVAERALRAEYEELELRYGARISVMVALRRTDNFRNPGVSSFTEYLERKDYDATGTIKSPLLVERLEDERIFLPLSWIYDWRQRLLALIDERFDRETSGVLKAALLGNRLYLSRATAERFRQGGTFHILVISGLHISFIGGLVFLIMRRITRRRAWQFAVLVLFLWTYAVGVGAESSVVRASLMFTTVALAPVLHRRARALNALGLAALALLVWRPVELFDPSFQLTFLSVLAIVTLAWPILERLGEIGRWRPTRATPHPPACPRAVRTLAETLFWSEREWRSEMKESVYSYRLWKTEWAARLERWRVQRGLRYCFGALVVSASVQVMLLPLFVLYFHRLPLASLILNMGVGLLMAALALLSLLALTLSHLSITLAAPFIWLAEHLNWVMVHSVDPFARLHLASIRLPEYTGWAASVYAVYYLPLTILIVKLSRWRPLHVELRPNVEKPRRIRFIAHTAGIALAALTLVIILHPYSARRLDGRLRVDFLDVGQGDAALVTMPDGTTLLVDGGGRTTFARSAMTNNDERSEVFERDARSIGEQVVSEYLWWRGLDRVDYIVATHADADHIDGLNDVMRNFHVRAAFVGRSPASDAEYRRFALTASETRVPIYTLGRGDTLQFGAVNIEVLWPERTTAANAPSRNDDSVTLRLRLGERAFLLTGDIEKTAELALAQAPETLRSDVVKAAHHGSKTSSTESFVAAAAPRYVIISVGLNSIFGHPHKEVLERWRASGAQILTTGRSGTITVSTDGRDLRVETFVHD